MDSMKTRVNSAMLAARAGEEVMLIGELVEVRRQQAHTQPAATVQVAQRVRLLPQRTGRPLRWRRRLGSCSRSGVSPHTAPRAAALRQPRC